MMKQLAILALAFVLFAPIGCDSGPQGDGAAAPTAEEIKQQSAAHDQRSAEEAAKYSKGKKK